MRRSVFYFMAGGILIMALGCETLAGAATNSPNNVEIFVAGKRYASFKDYQKKRLKETLEKEPNSDLAQMQDMLNDYVKTHQTTQSISLDPQKIKTIVINPEKSPPVK